MVATSGNEPEMQVLYQLDGVFTVDDPILDALLQMRLSSVLWNACGGKLLAEVPTLSPGSDSFSPWIRLITRRTGGYDALR